jgi:hypothetical protein
MPGEFDWDASTVVDPHKRRAGPFQHLVDSNPALGREGKNHNESRRSRIRDRKIRYNS